MNAVTAIKKFPPVIEQSSSSEVVTNNVVQFEQVRQNQLSIRVAEHLFKTGEQVDYATYLKFIEASTA